MPLSAVVVGDDGESFHIAGADGVEHDDLVQPALAADERRCQGHDLDLVQVCTVEDVEQAFGPVEGEIAAFGVPRRVGPNERERIVRRIQIEGVEAPAGLMGDEHQAAHPILARVRIAVLVDEALCMQKLVGHEGNPL